MVQIVAPKKLVAAKAKVTAKVAKKANADGTIDVTVTSDRVAIFVTLTTLAQGRFSDNCFLHPAGSKTVQFVPVDSSTAAAEIATLTTSLRIDHHSMYT